MGSSSEPEDGSQTEPESDKVTGGRMGRLKDRALGKGGTFRAVLTMLSGTSLAQLVTILGTIPLARLYTPTDFGLFAIAQAIVTACVGLAALRYDVAVVLPEKDNSARVLLKLASRSIVIFSTVMAVVLLLASRLVGEQYGNQAFGVWLSVTAVVVCIMAQIANIQYWLTRKQRFDQIARNRVTASLGMVVTQIILAPLVGGFQGLLIGMLLGQVVTYLILRLRVRGMWQDDETDHPTMKSMAYRYRKMPLLNAPNVAVDGLRNTGIAVLIGNIALGGLGQYSLAHRSISAPVYLINGAIAQVFLKRMATTGPGGMIPLLRALLLRIGAVSLPIFIVLYFISPELFPLIFGSQWREAGLLAQALIPWLFLNTFTSPLANVYIRIEKQEWLLGFACIYAFLPLLFLASTGLPLLQAVRGMAWIMSALLVAQLFMTLWHARRFDRS